MPNLTWLILTGGFAYLFGVVSALCVRYRPPKHVHMFSEWTPSRTAPYYGAYQDRVCKYQECRYVQRRFL